MGHDQYCNQPLPPFPLPAVYTYASPEASAFLGSAHPSLVPNGPGQVMQPPAWINYPPVCDPCAAGDQTLMMGMDCAPRPPPCITGITGDGLITATPSSDGIVEISSTGLYYKRQQSLLLTRARLELPVMLVTGDRSEGPNINVHAPPTTTVPGARLEQNVTTYRAMRHIGDNGPPVAGSGLQSYTRFNTRYDSAVPPMGTTATTWTLTLSALPDFANGSTYATPGDAYTNGTLGLDANPTAGSGPVVTLYIAKVIYKPALGLIELSGPLPRDDAGLRMDISVFNQASQTGSSVAHLLSPYFLVITGGWFAGATLTNFSTVPGPPSAAATGVVATRYETTAAGGPTATRMIWAVERGQAMALGSGITFFAGNDIAIKSNDIANNSGLVEVANAGTPLALQIGVAAGISVNRNVAVSIKI